MRFLLPIVAVLGLAVAPSESKADNFGRNGFRTVQVNRFRNPVFVRSFAVPTFVQRSVFVQPVFQAPVFQEPVFVNSFSSATFVQPAFVNTFAVPGRVFVQPSFGFQRGLGFVQPTRFGSFNY